VISLKSVRYAIPAARATIAVCGVVTLACSDSPLKFRDRVEPGHMLIHVTGAVQFEADWAGFGEFDDLLAADTGEFSLLGGRDPGLNTGDSILTVALKGRLRAGRWEIPGYASQDPGTAQLAFLIFDGPGSDDETVWASIPGGSLEIIQAAYPAAPGIEPGLMRGRLSLRAVGLVRSPGGMPLESGDTITVTAEFAADWYHFLFPNITLSLEGGPVAGASRLARAQGSDDDRGGLLVRWEADLDGLPGQRLPFDISHQVRIAVPAVGAHSVSRLTPPEYEDAFRWPAVYSALSYRDRADLLGLSAGGALTVTRYVAPTNAHFGEIHGVLNTDLPLWVDSTIAPSDTVRANAAFAVQLWPIGVPAAPPLWQVLPFPGWNKSAVRVSWRAR
jgi:hypothetical protein